MGNAIKFSEQGSRIIFEIEINDKSVRFSIKDQEIGIPEVLQPILFQANTVSGLSPLPRH